MAYNQFHSSKTEATQMQRQLVKALVAAAQLPIAANGQLLKLACTGIIS